MTGKNKKGTTPSPHKAASFLSPNTESSVRWKYNITARRCFQEKLEGSESDMRTANIESEVIRMGDVGVVIETVDSALSEGEAEKAERAVVILKEIFRSRYHRLRRSLYGGENDA